MKVFCCFALLICCVFASPRPDDYGGGDGGNGDCPEGTHPPLPPPTDDQAREAAKGLSEAMKPKPNETSQRFIRIDIPSDDKTCPKPIPPSDDEIARAEALIGQVEVPPGMVVDHIMKFDKDGKFVGYVTGDPYLPDSPERPDSAVQK